MNTKLTINLRDGILEVEGGDDFVRSIYEDFKGEVARRNVEKASEPLKRVVSAESIAGGLDEAKERAPRAKVKPPKSETSKSRSSDYKPKFDTALNLNGLVEFYDQLAPENAREKILIFAIFLRDHLKIVPCTVDQIYTCFFTVKDRTKIPEAFVQAFRDTQSKTHYIEMNGLDGIAVTIPGNNHFEQMKKRNSERA
jgi:hypothetical protein